MTAENHQDFAEAKTAPQVAIVDDESANCESEYQTKLERLNL